MSDGVDRTGGSDSEDLPDGRSTAIGISSGIAAGALIGAFALLVTGDVFWVAIGIALGTGLGAAFGARSRPGGA